MYGKVLPWNAAELINQSVLIISVGYILVFLRLDYVCSLKLTVVTVLVVFS